ncbi:MAG: hypothetical protein KF851_12495 [Pirellulaceae bacterium]|nr:hypothetical protein [Pirellulaceae bacterium]
MTTQQTRIVLATLVAILAFTSIDAAVTQAQGIKLPFGKRGAAGTGNRSDVGNELTETSGPWLIMCSSFLGDNAEDEARQLCEALHRELKLPTYYYRKNFDFSNSYEGLYYSSNPENTERDANGNLIAKPKKTYTARKETFNEIAVLVGDFPTYDDAKCQKTLETIKHMQLDTIDPYSMSRPLQGYRRLSQIVSENDNKKKKGPLGSAFVIANPLAPDEVINPNVVDNTILNLNKGIPYSLMDCPGQYSVRVASFKGSSTFNLSEIEESEKKMNMLQRLGKPINESKLAKAGENAHLLCTELRKLGIEAYEFHDRMESYVCVGSFDWVARDDAFGNKDFNPEVEKTILLFKGSLEQLPNQTSQAFVSKTLPSLAKQGIGFDVQPVPVLVPRANPSDSQRSAKLPWNTRNR